MMGCDPDTFAEKDVDVRTHVSIHMCYYISTVLFSFREAIQYLLPSRLTSKDARPFLKVQYNAKCFFAKHYWNFVASSGILS